MSEKHPDCELNWNQTAVNFRNICLHAKWAWFMGKNLKFILCEEPTMGRIYISWVEYTSSAEHISSTQYIIDGNVYHINGNVCMYLRVEYVRNIGKIGTIGRKDWLYRYYPLKCFLDDFQMWTQSKHCLLFNNNGIPNQKRYKRGKQWIEWEQRKRSNT